MDLKPLAKALKKALNGESKIFDFWEYDECDKKSKKTYRNLIKTIPLGYTFRKILGVLLDPSMSFLDTPCTEELINSVLNQQKTPRVMAFYTMFVRSNTLDRSVVLDLYSKSFEKLFTDVVMFDDWGNISIQSEWFKLFKTIEHVMDTHVKHNKENRMVYEICKSVLQTAAQDRERMSPDDKKALDRLQNLFRI